MSKRQRKTRISTIRIGETPTQERRHHNGGVITEAVDRALTGKILIKRYKTVWDCPLDVYRDRNVITDTEHCAGLKFRHAYFRAVLGLKIEDVGSGSKGDMEMAFLSPLYSEILLKEAYKALSAKQKDIVIDVCGHDECAGATAKLKTLHRGLEKLCEIWEINGLEKYIPYTANKYRL